MFEEAWSHSELIAEIIKSSEDYALILMDTSGKIKFANRGALKVLGYTAPELVGQSFDVIFVPEDVVQKVSEAELKKAAAAGFAEDERWHITKQRKRFWATGVVRPIRNESGELIGFKKLFRDKTSRKRTEDEIKQANAELNQFSYTAAHDLQAPLRSLVLCLQAAVKTESDSNAPEMRTAIAKSITLAQHMQTLIKDMLDFSEIGNAKKAKTPINSNAVFDMAVSYLKPYIEEHGAAITRGALPDLVANATQIESVFQNLITNAIKYRSVKPPVMHVSASQHADGHWLFCAEDNGVGIEPQFKERVFETFQRLQTREDRPGTGLGLAICKRIIEGHGGRIWVESNASGGSSFFFTLP